MPLLPFDWKPSYDTGHELIDGQHRQFLGIINQLIDHQDEEPDIHLALFEELQYYAYFHFKSEENRMVLSGYPEMDAHAGEHQMILQRLQSCFDRYQVGETTVEEILEFLVSWFAAHTAKVDKPLGDHLRAWEGSRGS